MTEGWPEPPGWEQQEQCERRRFDDERRLAKMEADMRVMREWPEYKPNLKGETDEHQRSIPEQIS